MKKICLIVVLFLLHQSALNALEASISFSTFKSPKTSFIELHLFVMGETVNYIPIDSTNSQAAVEVIILFKQNGNIVKFDKYNLNSPMSSTHENFVDLKRYGLENGSYELEVSIQDKSDETNTTRYDGTFQIDYEGEKLLQSDIQLLATYKKTTEKNAFVKNGYYLESLPFNFYHKNASQLMFYNEIYNADKASADNFIVSYGIELVKNEKRITKRIGHERKRSKPVSILLIKMDIADLASGNYELFVEIRNKEKKLLSRKTIGFQRSNPYLKFVKEDILAIDMQKEFVGELNFDELQYSLRAIAPLVKNDDVVFLNTILKKNNPDTSALQRFLFNFWISQEPNNPETMYHQYMEVAKAVDRMYDGGLGYGFESDRGFIFLRYGRPDDMIAVDNDPSAPPYEIWIYNDFPKTKQTNVKFLFYEPNLGTNFQLLHSTARGEINNPQWQLELYKNAPEDIQGANYLDATQVKDNWNRHASRYFNDF